MKHKLLHASFLTVIFTLFLLSEAPSSQAGHCSLRNTATSVASEMGTRKSVLVPGWTAQAAGGLAPVPAPVNLLPKGTQIAVPRRAVLGCSKRHRDRARNARGIS